MTHNRAKALEAFNDTIRYILINQKHHPLIEHAETIREALSEPKWKSMDSAPRDGTHIFTSDKGKKPEIASFNHGCWDIVGAEDIEYRPTHWMHLPDAPTGEKS